MDLIVFNSEETVKTETNKSHSLKPTIKVTEPLTIEKRSFSDSSLVDTVIEGELSALSFFVRQCLSVSFKGFIATFFWEN